MEDNVNFTPLQDFHDEDLRSSYCVGLNYTIRPGNDLLAAKVATWLEEGKVVLGTAEGSDTARSEVSGAGIVK